MRYASIACVRKGEKCGDSEGSVEFLLMLELRVLEIFVKYPLVCGIF